jgi:HlyD family secretion protein
MRRASLLLPLALVSLGPICLGLTAPLAHGETAPAETAAPVAPAITVSTVGTRLMRDRVIASGLIAPVEQVSVSPLVEGQPIEALLADVGDTVTAGQVLARLSRSTLDLQQSQLAASLASARAVIAQAEAQLIEAQSSSDEAARVATRTAALRAQGTASQAAADQALAAATSATARVTVAAQSLEAARAQLANVQAQQANLALQLTRTEVIAPFAGEIIARNAQLGAIATAAGQPMFVLIRDSALELRADVAESDLMRLAPGQTASLTLAGSATPLTGRVRLVEPSIDTTTRLARARISLDDASQVRSGMFVEAEILVVERETIAVPVTAVGAASDGATVMKVTDGTVTRTPVSLGIRDGGWVEVLSGLHEGDSVVTKAGSFVRDGDMITPVAAIPDTN